MKLLSFRNRTWFVGFLFVVFFTMMKIQGISKSMLEFKVPEDIAFSPYYSDSMHWVFMHMAVLGILIALIGFLADSFDKQKLATRILIPIFIVYLIFDIHTSDNPFGTALYKGPRSVFPVFVDLLCIVLFLPEALGLKVFQRKVKSE